MDQIEILLTRGVDSIYPNKEALEKVLRSGKKLRLYQGFDPTGTQLHIGHMTGLRKLAQFAALGHHVIFLVGDGTGQAGDPSGKLKSREKFFNREELRQNAKEYVMQAGKIIDFGKPNVEILYNGDWLNKLGLVEILEILGKTTHQQLFERDMFQERIKNNQSINMREAVYPLLQGYDSVAMKVDLELGGTDQTFNMLMGRQLVREFLGKEKFVMTTPLLADSKGVKIGKSEGNVIGLTDPPNDLYGKIMALGDDVILKGFEYLTDLPTEEIEEMKKLIASGTNPMTFKKQLAHTLVAQLNDQKAADAAQDFFHSTFQKHEVMGADIPTFNPSKNKLTPIDLLMETKLVASRADARRLLEQKAIEVDGTTITDKVTPLDLAPGMVIKVGKNRFSKIL